MKRITILAATLFALSGLQAQTGIDGVLRNIETNNKELQANAQLIASQKLEARTDNNLPDPTLSYAHLWNNKDKNNTIGELVVSQSFDFPSLYATRNQLNRLKSGAFDGQKMYSAKVSCYRLKMFVWISSCCASNNRYWQNVCETPRSYLPCMPNVCKQEMPT